MTGPVRRAPLVCHRSVVGHSHAGSLVVISNIRVGRYELQAVATSGSLGHDGPTCIPTTAVQNPPRISPFPDTDDRTLHAGSAFGRSSTGGSQHVIWNHVPVLVEARGKRVPGSPPRAVSTAAAETRSRGGRL